MHNPSGQTGMQIRGKLFIGPVDVPHHSIHIDRYFRQLFFLHGGAEDQQNFLGASQCKRRDQDFLSLLNKVPQHMDQPDFLCLSVGMQPVSVCRLHDHHIRPEFGNPESFNAALQLNRYIPGIKDGSLRRFQVDACRTGDMSRRIQGHLHLLQHFKRHHVMNRDNSGQHLGYIIRVVVRNFILPPVHDFKAVRQEDPGEHFSHGRHVNRCIRKCL